MKSFKEFSILTELKKEDFLPDAKKANMVFQKGIKSLFSEKEYKGEALFSTNLGADITYRFASTDWKVTAQNSKVHMQFMMHLTDNFGKVPDEMKKFSIELLQMNFNLKNAGVKYRKITGKSPSDATNKLIKWFKSNKTKIILVQEEI